MYILSFGDFFSYETDETILSIYKKIAREMKLRIIPVIIICKDIFYKFLLLQYKRNSDASRLVSKSSRDTLIKLPFTRVSFLQSKVK